jgi:Peptidase of plants and bacteria
MLGHGTAPSGLIEGIADFVRLRAGLAPPHWDRRSGKRWDEGYAVTGYFLDWIEKDYSGFVRAVNVILRDAKWDEEIFKLITGKDVDELWKEYRESLEAETSNSSA